jgi:hypothetical protein
MVDSPSPLAGEETYSGLQRLQGFCSETIETIDHCVVTEFPS